MYERVMSAMYIFKVYITVVTREKDYKMTKMSLIKCRGLLSKVRTYRGGPYHICLWVSCMLPRIVYAVSCVYHICLLVIISRIQKLIRFIQMYNGCLTRTCVCELNALRKSKSYVCPCVCVD